MELKNMTDQELANRIIGYIERLKKLLDDVSSINEKKGRIDSFIVDSVRAEYKHLKDEIAKDAHYVGLVRNENHEKHLYSHIFMPSLKEASAFGFSSATNSKINFIFHSSIEEAHYKLTKYYSLDKWKEIALDE